VHAVVFSSDGTRVAAMARDHGVRVFDAVAGAELCRVDHDDPVYAVAFSPDGTRLATGCGRARSDWGRARVFDAVTGAELCRVDHDDKVHAVAFSPDGTRLATGSGHAFGHRGCARVFDVATGAELCHLDHADQVNAVAFSPGGTRVATGGHASVYRGCVRVFDAATGAELCRLDHDDPVRAVVFSPYGTRGLIAAAGTRDRNGHVLKYDGKTGHVTLVRFDDPVYAFTPDLARVAIAHGTLSGDDHVRVFDIAAGVELSRLDLDNEVNAVAFSPQGTYVAVATGGRFITRNGSARVFEVTGAELCRLDHDGPVYAVAFSPDGMSVATGSHDNSARVWAVDRTQLIKQALDRLTRNLTQHEWRRYFRDEPYRKTRVDLP
jgi:WD40 repeat protein